jgi:hypothetical protein
LGAVDERLIEEGRLKKLVEPQELDLGKRVGGPVSADPSTDTSTGISTIPTDISPTEAPTDTSTKRSARTSIAPASRARRDPQVLVDLLLSPLSD